MNLKQYLSDLDPNQRKAFAERAGTNTAYLAQLAGGHRRPSPDMARNLARASGDQIPLSELRPDLWSNGAIG